MIKSLLPFFQAHLCVHASIKVDADVDCTMSRRRGSFRCHWKHMAGTSPASYRRRAWRAGSCRCRRRKPWRPSQSRGAQVSPTPLFKTASWPLSVFASAGAKSALSSPWCDCNLLLISSPYCCCRSESEYALNVLQRIGIPLQVLSQRALCAGLSSLTHATLPLWQSSSSVDQQGSSLARQVGAVMGLPHQSPAFLLGAGSSADPDSALLLDTNIQVRCPACPSPAQGRHPAIKHVHHAIAGGIRQ